MTFDSLKKAVSGALAKAKNAIKGSAIVKKVENRLRPVINGAIANVKKCVQPVKTYVNNIKNKVNQLGKTAQKSLISAVNGSKSSNKTVIKNQTKQTNKNIQNQAKPTNKNIGNLQKSLIAATGTTVYNNAVIPTGKKQTNGEINVANLPIFNSSVNYREGQKVKVKGLDGKWYVGTVKADGYIGTGGARQFKFIPDNSAAYSKGNSIENCRSYKYAQEWKDFAKGVWNGMGERSEKMLNSPNDFMNYLTMGVWNSNAENGKKMLKTKNAYDIINWATMGGADMVNGAVNPEKPLSPEHWMNSFGVVSTVFGAKGMQNKYTHNDIIDIKKPYKKAVNDNKIDGGSYSKGIDEANLGNLNGKTPATRVADKFRSLPASKRPNTVATIRTKEGKYIIGRNSGGLINGDIQNALDIVGINEFEGQCAEVNALARAMNKGIDLDGATISVSNVRGINSTNGVHGTFKKPCSTCDPLLEYFKILVNKGDK